ncbi:nucleotide exchange factor GrpE [Flavivirga eckloniae]|uniref:Protein GrpE n=1 Tax=Flavivirga eckloniae TaxID=1803846 RepID=A0A2K9PVC2_9FLAO|nr:nucleotide exchange factor GrpE [Flavivirga eckloniae]AUP81026.1 nucleotide exchange factor GrpE [Flavivirga eckloniae]
MSKKEKTKDIENDQIDGVQNETVEVEEQVAEEQEAEEQSVEEKLEAELKQEKDKFLRLFAEFENYKRRTAKERIELFSTASEDVMKTLLPVLDDFERALTHIEEDKEAEELRKGVLLIYQKLVKTLEQKGLTAIKVEKGEAFNADDHEAVTQIPAPSDDLKGKIIDIIEKGYKLGEKVIRFPKVVIGQ